MNPIEYIDRVTGGKRVEAVYGKRALRLLYGDRLATRLIGRTIRHLASRLSLCSVIYGWWQHQRWTARKIRPFIERFGIDQSEFLEPIESFRSFNDFFIRKLKPEARPFASGAEVAIIPADGRYFVYPNLTDACPIDIKGQTLDLNELIGDRRLASRFSAGSLVMARLCPTDYHRFHFPFECVPTRSRLINGPLFSVNPVAIRQNVRILSENKRMLTHLRSEAFHEVLCIEVGATNVGSIRQTYAPEQLQPKGSEKGYFEFGGSAVLLLFQPGRILFDADLIAATHQGLEMRCLLGQSMGKASSRSRG